MIPRIIHLDVHDRQIHTESIMSLLGLLDALDVIYLLYTNDSYTYTRTKAHGPATN